MWVFALSLGGCVSADDFPAQFTVASCDLAMVCQGTGVSLFDTRAQCVDFYDEALSIWTADCDFDPYRALECVSAVDDATCDDRDEIDDACALVYTGPDCIWSQ
jgi:hypothetical protein